MYITVYGASSNVIDKKYLDAAFSLGERIAERNHGLIFGAGDNGVMGASARGAYSKNGEIIGIAPQFFNVDGVLFPHCTRIIRPDTMRERKAMLEHMADGFVIAPGGIGTYDELFEILTLKQLDRHEKPIAILNVDGFYDGLIAFLKTAIEQRFMKEKTLELFKVVSTPDEALDYIEDYVHVSLDLSELKDVNLRINGKNG